MAMRRLLLLGVGLVLTGHAQAQGQKTLGVLFSGDASVRGAVLLRAQATEVLSGSQITAGEGSALLKLERGGQLRICPKTDLSLNAGASGQALSLGLNAGAMELDYALESGADSLITPDFRLLLISPGSFHLAISVAASGDTCMRSLPGNSASVFITEMMGNDSFQLAPGKNVLFLQGKIAMATPAPAVCGCPETSLPKTEVAEATPPPQHANDGRAGDPAPKGPASEITAAVAPPQQADSGDTAQTAETQVAASATISPTAQPSPEAQANPDGARGGENPAPQEPSAAADAQPEVAHLEVDSRFSYRGDEEAQDFYSTASRLSLSTDNSKLALALLPQLKQPGEPASAPHPGEPNSAATPAQASAPPQAAPHSNAAPNPKVAKSEPDSGGGFRRFFRRLFGGH